MERRSNVLVFLKESQKHGTVSKVKEQTKELIEDLINPSRTESRENRGIMQFFFCTGPWLVTSASEV